MFIAKQVFKYLQMARLPLSHVFTFPIQQLTIQHFPIACRIPNAMLNLADKDSEEKEDDLLVKHDQTFSISPRKDTNVESNFKELCIPNVTMNASDVDTNINSSEHIITSLPHHITVTPPRVPIYESNIDEGGTSNITKNLSTKDSNFIMGEGSLTLAIETIAIPPPQTSTIPRTLVPSVSPTLQGFMNDPITTLLFSQSTEPEI
ncbi:unnamed protein product [Lactuca saligna]|uniref:Uncharacterized protein n=1 Tax=Lactuca saligna TaxID=75948 RepID=A0AA35YXM3_LACSI|nr:unnamed protein product [Lactuca saligna]